MQSQTYTVVVAALSSLAAVTAPARAARGWTVVETSREHERRLAPIASPPAAARGEVNPADLITCDPAAVRQEIVGFGGALTESSAWVLAQLAPEKRQEILRRYFDPREGIGYTLARTHINSCDFSLHMWALDETPGDYYLHDFTLAPMRRWVMPLLHEVQSIAGADRFKLLASPWSPPAWMKTNNRMDDGGELRPEYRPAWASYFVRFVQAMRDEEHLPIWALTVQNEPEAKQVWESCLYTPEQERDFVRDHLGPALHAAGLDHVRLLALDHNRDILEKRAAAVLGDPESAKYLWGMALHWYVSEDFAAAARVHAAYPDKGLLFTEGCWEGGAKPGRWDRGERYARNMIGDFRNWVQGWIDWNIVLDLSGGPNHVGNLTDAPVLVDLATGAVHYQTSFYFIAHFSRYVQTGAHRIESQGGPAGLDSVAFANPDGSLVAVVFNATDAAVDFALAAPGDPVACHIPAHAIQTYVSMPR